MARATDDTMDMAIPPELSEPRERRPHLVVIAGDELGASRELAGRLVIGRGSDAGFVVSDGSISRRHAEIVRDREGVWVVDLGSRNGTFVNGQRVAGRAILHDGDRVQLGSGCVLRFTYLDTLDTDFHVRLVESGFRDALTGLHNRRFLIDRFPAEIAYAQRHHAPLAVVMFDVDHFKSVNDAHGHLGGDALLVAVAELAKRMVRAEDIVVRYGGEEFVVLCRSTSRAGALRLAERLREGVEALAVPYRGAMLRATISVGISTSDGVVPCHASALLSAADDAMYRAKRAGRNQVDVA